VYDDQRYAYTVDVDIDITDQVDGLGFPLTDLYLFADYNPSTNGQGQSESKEQKVFNASSDDTNFANRVTIPPQVYSIGDQLDGDLITYTQNQYLQETLQRNEYFINMPINTGTLIFRYFPFIPISVRVFGDLEQENENTTDIESKDSIPSFATPIDTDSVKVSVKSGFIVNTWFVNM
jgi:hypothetical protein